jgi:hypothetical protein
MLIVPDLVGSRRTLPGPDCDSQEYLLKGLQREALAGDSAIFKALNAG